MITFTVDQLFAFAAAGTLVSLILEYFPKLNEWYNAKPDNVQKAIVLAVGLVLVLGVFGLNCLAVFTLPWVCSGAGLWDAILAYLVFVFSTQGTYLIAPKKASA